MFGDEQRIDVRDQFPQDREVVAAERIGGSDRKPYAVQADGVVLADAFQIMPWDASYNFV